MKHKPVFRWVAALGLILVGVSLGLYWTAPDAGRPELKQINLTVLHEEPSGKCTVQWMDPYSSNELHGTYMCDPQRDSMLKAPNYVLDPGHGWDSGFVLASGPHKGDLYSLDQADDSEGGQLVASDVLVTGGVFLLVVGVVGGNIRTLARATGVNPQIVRRSWRLRDAAALVAQDHRQAVEAVRRAWEPERVLEEQEPELLAALRVLVEAGPRARTVAAAGGALADRLDPLLADAAPAAGRRRMLAASKEERRRAGFAVTELSRLLAEAEIRDIAAQFAQTSVDLLRGPDNEPATLSARVDFETRPDDYRAALTAAVGASLPPAPPTPAGDASSKTPTDPPAGAPGGV